MSMEELVAAFLLLCLACFFSINLFNILRQPRHRGGMKAYAEVEQPQGIFLFTAAAGTVAYFAEVLLYLLLVLSGQSQTVRELSFGLGAPFPTMLQSFGLAVTALGYLLFLWSVIVRGRYSVSWEMPHDHRLVTWGPYRHVRHPSYLGYFLMFVGLLSIWPNWLTLPLLSAIPGYNRFTLYEEELLVHRFGEEYTEYQRRTGRFLPKLR